MFLATTVKLIRARAPDSIASWGRQLTRNPASRPHNQNLMPCETMLEKAFVIKKIGVNCLTGMKEDLLNYRPAEFTLLNPRSPGQRSLSMQEHIILSED